jgi:AcrR family transcriptional regulator
MQALGRYAVAKTMAPRGFARDRVLEAAQTLFTEHGVSGTTLQMIADRLGVNKSAVYYQFHSKDDIVVAVFRPVFEDIARVVNIAEAITSREVQREATISGLIELAVRHRRTTALAHTDPAVVGVVEAVEEFRDASRRLQAILAGPDPDPATLIAIAVLVPGILGAAADPTVAEIANDELHRMLLDCSRRLFTA